MIHQAISAVACRAGWLGEVRWWSKPSALQDCWRLIVRVITPQR